MVSIHFKTADSERSFAIFLDIRWETGGFLGGKLVVLNGKLTGFMGNWQYLAGFQMGN